MATKTTKSPTKTTKIKKIAPAATIKSNSREYFYGTGKRKTSTARVRIFKDGQGEFVINDRPIKKYFTVGTQSESIFAPLQLTGLKNKFDISAKVVGGGINSQADAIRHGIARALLKFDDSLRSTLKKAGLLTRDSRVKERKKPGLKRARRAPQFSKR